jgi:hypothetical protein
MNRSATSHDTSQHIGVPVALARRPLHPRHGIHAPRPTPPSRKPGSIRRTSTIDTIRPGDILGAAVQIGRARDVRTTPDGNVEVLGTATVESRLAHSEGYRLVEITSDPLRPELDELNGRPVSTGFRAAVAELVPDELENATLLHLLLDDLPGAALVSGYAIGAAGATFVRDPNAPVLQIEGLCAGFQRGGTIMVEVGAGRLPPVVTGPPAPSLLDDDRDAWHEVRALGAHDMRRWRCLDVVPGATPTDLVSVEAYFRDSHMDAEGHETVIHEYTVVAAVDPSNEAITYGSAEAHTLPWLECIEAVGSGERLGGRPLRGLRPDVRAEFVGITTCTHLNDTMRSIEDVRALLPLL